MFTINYSVEVEIITTMLIYKFTIHVFECTLLVKFTVIKNTLLGLLY